MGSYLAHGPEIYPKAHENPRAFSCIFGPIFLEVQPIGIVIDPLQNLKRSILMYTQGEDAQNNREDP